MRKIKKTYTKPRRPWDKNRLEEERKLMNMYGLKRKKELWKVASLLRGYRQRARNLAATKDEAEEKRLLERLFRLGLLEKNATLNDVLGLTIENLLQRRLQTIIHLRGMANTARHARLLITHGHISVEGRRIMFPSFMITRDVEGKIDYCNYVPPVKVAKEVTESA